MWGLSLTVLMCQGLGGFMMGDYCLSQKDITAIFSAMGYQRYGTTDTFYETGCVDKKYCTLTKDNIGFVKDINGDKRPEVFIIDYDIEKYGMTGASFTLLTQDKSGYRVLINDMIGHYEPLGTKGKDNYPDVLVSGRGLCHGVWRYDGKVYQLHRHQTHDGEVCSPND